MVTENLNEAYLRYVVKQDLQRPFAKKTLKNLLRPFLSFTERPIQEIRYAVVETGVELL